MKMIRDPVSGALLGVPSDEEKQIDQIKYLLRLILEVLPTELLIKIDKSKIKEVLGDV